MNHTARVPSESRLRPTAVVGSVIEKRGHGRIPAPCGVELRYGRKLGALRRAELLNVGRRGFRARHGDSRINVGKLVAFRHEFAKGFARVRWTRPVGESFESGFEIVQKQF